VSAYRADADGPAQLVPASERDTPNAQRRQYESGENADIGQVEGDRPASLRENERVGDAQRRDDDRESVTDAASGHEAGADGGRARARKRDDVDRGGGDRQNQNQLAVGAFVEEAGLGRIEQLDEQVAGGDRGGDQDQRQACVRDAGASYGLIRQTRRRVFTGSPLNHAHI
jgi:hypothetical protein